MRGDKITNVANGTDPLDAVNFSQLQTAKTEVLGAKQARVSESVAAAGHTQYTVSATKTTMNAGGGVSVSGGEEDSEGI